MKEGDVLTPIDGGTGIALQATNADLTERMRAAGPSNTASHLTLQDLSKLA